MLQLDVTSQESIDALGSHFKDVPLDLLINNAGISKKSKLDQVTKDEMIQVFEVNAVGPLMVTRRLVESLSRAKKENGLARVVNITSRMVIKLNFVKSQNSWDTRY